MLLNAGVFNSLTCKCASRHSGVQFFDIKPPKSGPYPSVFPHFDLQICFAPQRRAIFEHRNVQNGSGIVVFSTFWLTNVLRATAAWHFGTSELPKWLRDRGVLCILTCKCASRHSGVAFFEHRNFHILTYKCASRHSRVAFWNIGTSKMAPGSWCFVHFDLQMCFAPQRRGIFWTSQLPKWLRQCGVLCILTCKCAFRHSRVPFFTCPRNNYLRTRRFSEPTFRTSGTTIHWENTAIRDFTNIFRACWTACERLYAHVDLLASDLTDVDLLATDMTAVRLCFSTLHIVGS